MMNPCNSSVIANLRCPGTPQGYTSITRICCTLGRRFSKKCNMRLCVIQSCNNPHMARGYCMTHYSRWRKTGSAMENEPVRDMTKLRHFNINELEITQNLLHRFWKKVEKTDGCWEWSGCKARGYGKMSVYGFGFAAETATRISWRIHFGRIPEGKWILHKCDNPPCVRPDHLFIGDAQTNVDDMITKGRNRATNRVFGESNHLSVLTESKVLEILKTKPGTRGLAKKFGVHRDTVWNIRTGKTWKHLQTK